MIGGFLHLNGLLGRENAQDFRVPESILARPMPCGSLHGVLVTRSLRVRSGSLHRYPSPVGWSARPPGAPPAFLPPARVASRDRRRPANISGRFNRTLIFFPVMPSCVPALSLNKEGTYRCSSPNGSPARLAPLHLPAVATRRLSRVLSARAPARPRPSFLMATRLPALSWAARPTCFTASSTPRAADGAARLRPRAPALSKTDHRTLTRSGGFLLSEEPFPAAHGACGQEQEGT